MNYRHAFHAGNVADCVKHALLVWLIRALQRKAAPICVMDTHAGAGAYDLAGQATRRTGEAEAGILRLIGDPAPELSEYLAIAGASREYPGSPMLARALLRPGDRLVCCELHPEESAALRARMADGRVAVHRRDGWAALTSLLPPKERRGLVLIDPPYEAADEHRRLIDGFRRGLARFPGGVFVGWYPLKGFAAARAMLAEARAAGIRDLVTAELLTGKAHDAARLGGSGLLVANPPYGFEAGAGAVLAALRARLAPDGAAHVTRVTDE